MKAVLLCAGFGTRMYPLTRHRAKPLLPVAGKPIVEHLLDQLYASKAVERAVVVTNRRFHSHFLDWARRCEPPPEVIANDADEPESLRGAVSDLAFAVRERHLAGPLLVAAGDNLFRMSFETLFRDYRSRPRNLVLRYRERDRERLRRTAVLELDDAGRILGLFEKPERPPSDWACPALYLLQPDAVAALSRYVAENPGADALGPFIGWLADRLSVYTHEMRGERLDVGDPAGYAEAEAFWRKKT